MIILDTRTLIWVMEDNARLGDQARTLIASTPVRFASVISHAEIAIKAMRGKLKVSPSFATTVSESGFEHLPLHNRHIAGLRSFGGLVGHDPFDRLLIAQAHVEKATLITADRVLLAFDGTFDATT